MNLKKYEIPTLKFLETFLRLAWQHTIAIVLVVSILMIMYFPLVVSYKMTNPIHMDLWLNPHEVQMIVVLFVAAVLQNLLIIGLPVILMNAPVCFIRKEIPSASLKSTGLALVAVAVFFIAVYGIAYRNKEYNVVSKFYRQFSQASSNDLCQFVCDSDRPEEDQFLALLMLAHRKDDETIGKIRAECLDAMNTENIEAVFSYIEKYSSMVSNRDQPSNYPYLTESRMKEAKFLWSYRGFKRFSTTSQSSEHDPQRL
jgi:hypothetical protein